jgi:hypothetical protein
MGNEKCGRWRWKDSFANRGSNRKSTLSIVQQFSESICTIDQARDATKRSGRVPVDLVVDGVEGKQLCEELQFYSISSSQLPANG